MLPLIREGKEAKLGEPAGSPAALRFPDAQAHCPQFGPRGLQSPAWHWLPRPVEIIRVPLPWELDRSPLSPDQEKAKKQRRLAMWGTGRDGAGPQSVCLLGGRRLICSSEGDARRAALPCGCDCAKCQFGGPGGRWR